MSTTDALIALAQFSLTLAGFIGALVAFVARGGRWHPADSFRTRRALAASLGVAFLAMLAIALELAGVRGEAQWRAANAACACYGVLATASDLALYWRERAELRGVIPAWGVAIVYASSAAIIAVQASCAVGALPPGAAIFFATQLYTLLLPAFVFSRIPFVRPAFEPASRPRGRAGRCEARRLRGLEA